MLDVTSEKLLVEHRKAKNTFTGSKSESDVTYFALSPDGGSLAAGSVGTGILLWDTSKGILRHHLLPLSSGGREVNAYDVEFSPDGRTLIGFGELANQRDDEPKMGGVQFWDVETGASMAVLKGHARPIVTAAMSPQGRILATGDDQGSVTIWVADDPSDRGQRSNEEPH